MVGCSAALTRSAPSSKVAPVVTGEPTVTVTWGAPRSAPEMEEALAQVQEQYSIGGFHGDEVLAGRRLGKGRFFGVVVSWMLPGAKTQMPPGTYAEVLVTVDGRLGPAPETTTPFGFITDGSAYGDDGAAMAAYKRDAVALADSYVGPGLRLGLVGMRGVLPYVSAYVVKYPWGFVVLTPAFEMAETASIPGGGWPLIRPLPAPERDRLNGMSATEVAQVFLRNEDYSETYWLRNPEARYEFIAYLAYPGPRMRLPGTTVQLDQDGVGDGFGYGEVKTFKPTPPIGDDYARVAVGRRSRSSPWRVTGLGH
jgi:hypothetical protein